MAVFISTVLVTAPVMEAQADVATVTVVGGTIGTIGAGLSALLPPAAVILTVGLACAGIDIYISQASEQQGLTKTEYVEQQIYNYSQLTNQSTEEIAKGLLNGVSVAKDGTLYLGQSALNKIKQIGNWITGNTANNYVNGTTVPAPDDYVSIGNIDTSYGSYVAFDGTTISFSTNVALFQKRSGRYISILGVSTEDFTVTVNGNTNYQAFIRNGLYYRGAQFSSNVVLPYYDYSGMTENAFIDSLTGNWQYYSVGDSDTFVGLQSGWSDFVPGLALPEGYTGAIDTNILQDIIDALGLDTSYDLTVDNFLEAIKEAINEGVADIPLSIPADGTMVVAPDIPMVLTPEYEQVAPVDIPAESDRTIVIDDEALAPTEDIIDDMKLQLKDVFPFCIPFDIYDILSKFNATPEAPRIVVNFTLPLVNQQINYTFDLSPFNDVASVLRVMELVAAVVGLAVATRSIFIRA